MLELGVRIIWLMARKITGVSGTPAKYRKALVARTIDQVRSQAWGEGGDKGMLTKSNSLFHKTCDAEESK